MVIKPFSWCVEDHLLQTKETRGGIGRALVQEYTIFQLWTHMFIAASLCILCLFGPSFVHALRS